MLVDERGSWRAGDPSDRHVPREHDPQGLARPICRAAAARPRDARDARWLSDAQNNVVAVPEAAPAIGGVDEDARERAAVRRTRALHRVAPRRESARVRAGAGGKREGTLREDREHIADLGRENGDDITDLDPVGLRHNIGLQARAPAALRRHRFDARGAACAASVDERHWRRGLVGGQTASKLLTNGEARAVR